MKRKSLRLCTVILAALLIVLPAAAWGSNVLYAEASSVSDTVPDFYLQTNRTSAKTDELVTVSFYVDNMTSDTVTNFSGSISYNSQFFEFYDATVADLTVGGKTGGKLTYDTGFTGSSSKIPFTYTDKTRSVIGAKTKKKLLLELRFLVIAEKYDGSGVISMEINECYKGDIPFFQKKQTDQVSISVKAIPRTTAPPATTAPPTTASTTVARSKEARLSELSVSSGTLTPAFSSDFVAYTVSVPFEVADIRINATAISQLAIIYGIGVKELAVGQNNFTVTVTAEDGSIKQYGIIVYREAEAADIPPEDNTVDPGFVDIDDSPVDDSGEGEAVAIAMDYPDTNIDNSGDKASMDGDALKTVGIIFAEIALFFFGFLSGFFIDKNIKKKAIIEQQLSELPMQYDDYGDYEGSDGYDEYDEYSDYDEYGGVNGVDDNGYEEGYDGGYDNGYNNGGYY